MVPSAGFVLSPSTHPEASPEESENSKPYTTVQLKAAFKRWHNAVTLDCIEEQFAAPAKPVSYPITMA
ncbi:uncharacterized protein N7483_012516 [Penicillium malachiteum]|uniref:uncharacterized protein n=1 Tax=Penicillium malachiteum TaxID=1324776 RepID=UPI002547FDA3|nr:uncharacterized protein N7483_012516 [Penicillium malachiteum]KAJ5715335.1 hypothetical protein N7483_012516 [Penicillium malachiteum]